MNVRIKQISRLVFLGLVIISLFGPWGEEASWGDVKGWTFLLMMGSYTVGICFIPIGLFFFVWILAIVFYRNGIINWLFWVALFLLFVFLLFVIRSNVHDSSNIGGQQSNGDGWGALMFVICITLAFISEMVFYFVEKRKKEESTIIG